MEEARIEEVVNRLREYAMELLITHKMDESEVRTALVDKGVSYEIADLIVSPLVKEIHRVKQERGNKDMMVGGLWLAGGILVTVLTFSAASGGGTYVIAYGAIIAGLVQFVRGMMNSSSD